MERLPKGMYTPEFRAEAVKLVEMTGMSIARATKQSDTTGKAGGI